ncbi:MAG: ATP-grasp ribosomal peptide maturase, partial [Actinobacteria bacterium]|nr:ATP-grasp ribosomal peptide maturase [Actinomycetota bacterium]
MTILILARNLDSQADRLVEMLGERGVPVFRTDLAAIPMALSLDAQLGENGWEGVLATEHREVRLSEIRSIWYRRPTHFELPEGMSGPEWRHAAAEARCGLGGVLSSLDVLWVNYPSRESDALKPRQLQVARRCGLRVPDSLVTNRPASVRDFARNVGGALAGKTLAAALLVESGRLQMAYTRRIEPAELDDLAGVEVTAHLFQPFLTKAWEARVTVVGDRMFAAAIHARSEAARVDFRADYGSHDYAVVEPPESVAAGMLRFLEAFGLSFGAFDFAVTPDGEWIMFECNPFGQYGWLEEALDLPITAARPTCSRTEPLCHDLPHRPE